MNDPVKNWKVPLVSNFFTIRYWYLTAYLYVDLLKLSCQNIKRVFWAVLPVFFVVALAIPCQGWFGLKCLLACLRHGFSYQITFFQYFFHRRLWPGGDIKMAFKSHYCPQIRVVAGLYALGQYSVLSVFASTALRR